MPITAIPGLEGKFHEVYELLLDVRTRKLEYVEKEGRLIVYLPAYVLVVEAVEDILMYSMVRNKNWDILQTLMEEYSIDYESLVCFLNANNWSVAPAGTPLLTAYKLTMQNIDNVTAVNVDVEALPVNNKIEPTIFGDITYTLVGFADSLRDGEFGVSEATTIYGVFNNMKRLERAYKMLREKIARAEENEIREARHTFSIHPFVPNQCFGFGTEVSSSLFFE